MITDSELEPLNYDDVLLLPNYSEIDHRGDVNLNVKWESYYPIFSSPMKNISNSKLVIALGKLGGIGVLHRFFNTEKERNKEVDRINNSGVIYGVSIGLNDFEKEIDFLSMVPNYSKCKFVFLDAASGHMKRNIETVRKLYDFREYNGLDFKIVSGNVVTLLGANELAKAGSNMIRVNIGSGGQCLTSTSIGIGCPTLTAIRECSKIRELFPMVKIIADGGISNPGKALKSFVFGSDYIILGSLLGHAKECENNGEIFGMSSYHLQSIMNKEKRSNEGRVTKIPKEEIRPLEDIWNEFVFGIKSGMSYLGIDDINEIDKYEAEYVKTK